MVDASFNFLPTRPAAEIGAEYVQTGPALRAHKYLADLPLLSGGADCAAGKGKSPDQKKLRSSLPRRKTCGDARCFGARDVAGYRAILAAVGGDLPA
jgi:hypothetical protein